MLATGDTASGNYNFSGDIKAAYFFGDASYLTNVPAGTEHDPKWSANKTNVAFINQKNIFGNFNQSFNGTTLFINSNLGRVGIGTTGPVASLGVYKSDHAGIYVENSNANARGGIEVETSLPIFNIGMNTNRAITEKGTNPSGGWMRVDLRSTYEGFHWFWEVNGSNTETELMTIKGTSGNVGINTSSPTSKLEVLGDIELTNLLDNDASNFFDGACTDNQYVTGISSTGAVTCSTDSALGTVTSVGSGTGLTGGPITASGTLNVGAGTCITSNADDVAVTADCIGDTQLAFNTGQALTTTSNVQFRDIIATRDGGTTGVIYFGANAGSRYLYYDGASYYLNGAGLTAAGLTNNGNLINSGYISITGVSDGSGNLRFSAANPYIYASSYFIAPGGAYFNSLTVYTEAELRARGGIADDGGDLILNDAVSITGSLNITGATAAADHGAASTDEVVNAVYTTAACPTASTTTIGALCIVYTP